MMARVIDALSVVLLLGSVAAFSFGFFALADRHDLLALYCMVVGALALRAATNLLRPKARG